MSDTQLAELAKEDFEADHSLGEVGAIEGVDAVGADHAALDLYLAHSDTVHGLAREEACLVDCLGGDIQEVVRENLLAVLYHLNQLLLLELLALLRVRFHVVVDVDGSQLRGHALVEHSADEVVILLGEWTLSIIPLLGQIETNDIAAILLVETGKVFLGGGAALILHLVNDDVVSIL